MNLILTQTLKQIHKILGDEAARLSVERVVVGLFFTGVKLSNGVCGISYTPLKSLPHSGGMVGKGIEFFTRDINSPSPLKKTIAIAVINALSQTCFQKNPSLYNIKLNADPFDELTFKDGSFSVIIGALVPYIKDMMKNGRDFRILELDKSVLKENELVYYLPASEAKNVVPKADNLIITGTTLINDTLEEILSFKKDGADVVVVGPTVSMLPQALFECGVKHIGGVYTTHADELLDIIAQAGSGYHFFKKFANKFAISDERRKL